MSSTRRSSVPFVRLYYTTAPYTDRIYAVKTNTGIDYDGDGGYTLTDAAREEFRASILTAADGQLEPEAMEGLSLAEVRIQY